MKKEKFQFTPENLLDNLHKLGPWSSYHLASIALQHYFPDAYNEEGNCDIAEEVKLMDKLGCNCWADVIVKYHQEVGYVAPNGFDPLCVNEF